MATTEDSQASSYNLRGKWEILEKLRLLERRKTRLSIDSVGRIGFISHILKIVAEKGLLVFDASANEAVNKALLEAGHATFSGKLDGVETSFRVERVAQVTLNGAKVFAAALPDSLFWLERRQFYRVAIPSSLPVHVLFPLDGGHTAIFPILDLSLSGLALLDQYRKLPADLGGGGVLSPCRIDLPTFGDETFALQLVYRQEIPAEERRRGGLRAGFRFLDKRRGFDTPLQKLLYELERMKKDAEARD